MIYKPGQNASLGLLPGADMRKRFIFHIQLIEDKEKLSVTWFDVPKNHNTSKSISEEKVPTNGNNVTDIKIEPVIDMYDNNQDDIKSENKGAFCQEFVWSKIFLGY